MCLFFHYWFSYMKIISSHSKKPFITVVGCLHGDEIFGRTVFSYFRKHHADYPNIKLILAHEEAIRRRKRFIERDLNRSFPGNPHGVLEERLAATLLAEVRSSRFVLDIHTTTSDIRMTPIITKFNRDTIRVAKLCPSHEVVFVRAPLGAHALVTHVDGGVSLEFNRQYARTAHALDDMVRVVNGLTHRKQSELHYTQILYDITRTISPAERIPPNAENFKYIRTLGLYPFLLHEKAYTDFVAFGANRRRAMPR